MAIATDTRRVIACILCHTKIQINIEQLIGRERLVVGRTRNGMSGAYKQIGLSIESCVNK